MLCMGVTFVKKNCLVARIVSFDTARLHLITFRILLEPYLSKDIELELSTLSNINDVIIVPSN